MAGLDEIFLEHGRDLLLNFSFLEVRVSIGTDIYWCSWWQ